MTVETAAPPPRPFAATRFVGGAMVAGLVAVAALLSLVWTPQGGLALPPLAEPDAAHWLGVDGAGLVAAVGEGVDLPLGTRVAYHQSLSRDGSFAEYCLLDANLVMHIPANLDDAAAAAVPCPALTAWQALAKVADGASHDVLVVGAGGAVGFYLVQLAVQLALGRGPDVGHRLLEKTQQVVTAAGMLGQ